VSSDVAVEVADEIAESGEATARSSVTSPLAGFTPPSDQSTVPRGVYRPVPKTFESLVPDSLKKLMEFPGFAADNISRTRQEYLAMGAAPSHLRYGWVRRA